MQKIDPLIRTKLRLPFIRPSLVPRMRLQARIAEGLQGPLTLVIAPAGFGKTTLVAASLADCAMPVAWLSLDRDDNQTGRFSNYLIAALQGVDPQIGSEAAQLVAGMQQPPAEAVLTSLINDLEIAGREIVLVLDDYQFIHSQVVHEQMAFLLGHCPNTFHILIASRSDPTLPLARLRARGQTVELRAADLRFTELEATQFLNDVMELRLEAESVVVLEERTEGWIAGLQMAALSMRDREDIPAFIEGFSGTNRYILDYLLEEVLAGQSPEIQRFLLCTSILERLTAPLCDAVLADDEESKRGGDDQSIGPESLFAGQSARILEYLERANLFLLPLDNERIWYRYHHLFADLLRTQLQRSLGEQDVAQLHIRASEWHAQNCSILEAIHHASMASDDERVERFIEQHYRELVNRGEMMGYRFWTGRLSKEMVYHRPWLCIYEAYSHAWFGELDEADRLLEESEKRFRLDISSPDEYSMQAHFAYIRSRVTAMRGDIQRAVEFCLTAREHTPASNLALHFDTCITLGYEYFLCGDYANANQILNEAIRSGITAGSIIYVVAASCIMARLNANQGLLHQSYETYQVAARLIAEAGEKHRDATALVEVGTADLLCEWNDLETALVRLQHGIDLLPFWGKTDDFILAYVTLMRIQLAQANSRKAIEAVEKANQLIQTRGIFSEARSAFEVARVKCWLAQGDVQAANRWAASVQERLDPDDPFRFENEVTHIALARILIAQNKPERALDLLTRLEETARSTGRMGRVIEILLLKALALQEIRHSEQALLALAECLALAEPGGYVRIFLDEGQPMQLLLAQWLAHADPDPLRDHVIRLLTQFDAEPQVVTAVQKTASPTGDLVEPLSERELEILHLIATGRTNKEIAQQLIVSLGTVKAHTASIFRKLDVANRTKAVAQARQLGILP